MAKIDFKKEADNILNEARDKGMEGEKLTDFVASKLKQMYNYSKGWKRDREFLSNEEHEKKYAPKRKTPAKTYKRK